MIRTRTGCRAGTNAVSRNEAASAAALLFFYCSLSAFGNADERALFVDVTDSLGLLYVHDSGLSGAYRIPEVMGSGVAVFDYDQDNDLDIYIVGGLPGAGRLYRRTAGGDYEDVTKQANLHNPGYGMGAALGDIDNDGDVDLYLTNLEDDRLLRNDGDGTCTDGTATAGIDAGAWSSSSTESAASWATRPRAQTS